jgi:hypothetical protein
MQQHFNGLNQFGLATATVDGLVQTSLLALACLPQEAEYC